MKYKADSHAQWEEDITLVVFMGFMPALDYTKEEISSYGDALRRLGDHTGMDMDRLTGKNRIQVPGRPPN